MTLEVCLLVLHETGEGVLVRGGVCPRGLCPGAPVLRVFVLPSFYERQDCA